MDELSPLRRSGPWPKLVAMPEARKSLYPVEVRLDDLPLSPALRALVERVEPRHYRKNTLLIQEGDVGDTIYVVLAGRVKAFSVGEKEREVTYGEYGPGDLIGEMSLDGGPRSASVLTLDPTVCAVVTRQTLLGHLAQYPEFAIELIAKVIRRARNATEGVRQMALNDVYGRLRSVLEGAPAERRDDGALVLTQRLTHEELSFRLGCSRGMVSRLMKDLEQGRYIGHEGQHLVLLRALPARW